MAAMGEVRQPVGTGVALRDPLPWPEFACAARLAEELGYVAAFLPEIAGRDALATLTGLAGETSHMLLGTGVVPMTARTPHLTARGAATVHERSGGRAILGLGTGPAVPGALARMPGAPASPCRFRRRSRSGSRRWGRGRSERPARWPTACS